MAQLVKNLSSTTMVMEVPEAHWVPAYANRKPSGAQVPVRSCLNQGSRSQTDARGQLLTSTFTCAHRWGTKDRGIAQWWSLPSLYKALGSIPSMERKEGKRKRENLISKTFSENLSTKKNTPTTLMFSLLD